LSEGIARYILEPEVGSGSTQRCPGNAQSPIHGNGAIQNLIEEVHVRLRGRLEGKVADTLPELAKVANPFMPWWVWVEFVHIGGRDHHRMDQT